MEKNKLRLLRSQREYVFRDIQILYDLSREMIQDRSKESSFKSRCKRIHSIREEYMKLSEQINELKLELKPDSEIDLSAIIAFDDLYYTVISAADQLEASSESVKAAGAHCSSSRQSSVNVQLPKLELPRFNGNTEDFQVFFDTFKALIHENKSLSDIEKYHYLISCLSGPALSIVKGIPVTANNYQIVYAALIERYQNKRILAVTYLDQILNYPVVRAGNYRELQNLTNVFYESSHALEAINIENLSEFILFHLASRSLDADTRMRFETQNSTQIPNFSDLLKFLQDYVKILETTQLSPNPTASRTFDGKNNSSRTFDSKKSQPNNRQSSGGSNRSSYLTESSPPIFKCLCCGEGHSIYRCPTFQSLNSRARLDLVKNKKMCTNCLRNNHVIDKCISKVTCSTCGLRHHSLLHIESPRVNSSDITQASTSAHIGSSRSIVLLGTCQLRVCNTVAGTQRTVRALIDSGAQDSFITTDCARKLGLKLHRCNLTVAGLGQNTVFQVRGVTQCVLQPLDNDDPLYKLKPIVLDNITSQMPSVQVPSVVRNLCQHFVLADRDFDRPGPIDLLIGAVLFSEIYDGQRVKLGPGLPTALHSVFGWILTGAVDIDVSPPPAVSSLLAASYTLDEQVRQFWEVEEPPRARITKPEDDICESMYANLTSREPNGRYVVPILLKDRDRTLGDSYNISLSRLNNLEKKLSRQPLLKAEYTNFMHEYEDLGHMQRIESSQSFSQQQSRYLIPHHCVIRPESTTTKLRVVFDASCKTTNGQSLNDLVYAGPKLQIDIIDIITNFRLHRVVFTCDISKMYRQIFIRPEDRCYQHVLWRESPSDPVTEYELSTVTYGVSSSPYLAIRTLHQLAVDHGDEYPRAAEAILHETFMDDVTTGAPSVEDALKLKDDLIKLLSYAQLELRKWSSNSSSFLQTLPADHCQSPKPFSEQNDKNMLKILGVQYDPKEDSFTYSHSPIVDTEHTKRSILSNVARIFDPLGWLTPVILKAKLLLQDLWRLNLSWDEPVPRDLSHDWRKFISDLNNLNRINISRHVIPHQGKEFSIVGYCDGSTKAYGCSVYLRAVTDDQVNVHLLIAKSKVAPLKVLTVNRLELCGAVLLAKVASRIYSLLSKTLNLSQCYLFTDSSTVLSWLNAEPHKLKTFVAHRVVQITDAPAPFVWRHVSTHDNPADLCSRGLPCSQLATCENWWSGPQWLTDAPDDWPVSAVKGQDNLPELKSSSHLCNVQLATQDADVLQSQLEHSSSFSRVQRVVAWIYRFIDNAKHKCSERNLSRFLTSTELDRSVNSLVKYVQHQHLPPVVSNKKSLPRHISKLSPFVDSLGIIRVGGRLGQTTLPDSVKHPYLLPKSSRLCQLLIDHFHATYLHCGPRLLQSLIQRRFWILGLRNLIRSRLSKCVTCFKTAPTHLQPLMGELPSSRVTPQCFQNIGIDFSGPNLIKESRRRNARSYKAYLCLIVCHSTKAVHLELVTELTTEAFIAAFDRFVSRRGLCKLVVTDGGTNFIGAKRYLSEVSEMLDKESDSISQQLASRGITWKINPASGAHFGGIFERSIRSTKYHLRRVIGTQVLTYEEFYTVLTKIEAMLNSRPLVELSSDPCEVDALTAGHFLIGRPLVSLPEPVHEENVSLRSRWQLIQRLTQSFWRTWQRDYLHTLQQRVKWFKSDNRQPKLNDLVSIVEPNLPPNEWRLGRIVKLHPGKDNIIRVVTVKTAKGLLVRPAVKICPLPIEEQQLSP